MVQLGLAEKRADKLVERLLHWQWPDGGWNCDRNPSAEASSFIETLTPMRGLAAYARLRNDKTAGVAARAAAEVFLSRNLFRRRSDGSPIEPSFLKLHFPLDWHYDLLGGLVAMAEMDLLGDERCEPALDLLESKRLADGGWPAEAKFLFDVRGTAQQHSSRRLGRQQQQADESLGDCAGVEGAGQGPSTQPLTLNP